MTPDMAQRIDDVIEKNPGLSFTFIMNQALANWIQKPTLNVDVGQFNSDDVNQFMHENSDLMDDLGK